VSLSVPRLLRGFVVAAALAAATGCGTEDVGESDADTTRPDASGALRLYTSLEEELARKVVAAYERDTGMQVDLFRAKSAQVAERVAKETKAGVDGADVVETNGPELTLLSQADALDADEPDMSKLVDGVNHQTWTTTRFNLFTVSRNTKAVSDAERPKSLTDLTATRWKGRLAMEGQDYDWYLTLRDHWMKSEGLSVDEADARFEGIARNARVVDGHSFMDELVAAGEFDIGVSDYSYTVETTAAHGAPVAWEPPIAPLISRANGVAVVRGSKRPAAARKFITWLLDDGQEVLRRYGMQVARRDLVYDPGVEVVDVDIEDYVERREEAMVGYENVLKQAGKGPEEEK
jgi:iron(III) transport system substrate-binding protein